MNAVTSSGDHAVVGVHHGMSAIVEVHRSLPIPSDNVVRWLIHQGIGDDVLTLPWPLKEARVVFADRHTFDFDDSGEPALIFRAEDRGECTDLIVWSARTNKIASWRNAAFCLGDQDDCFNPGSWALGGALRVHRTPLEWLKANRDGITIIRPDLTYAMLRHVPRIVFADAAYGRQVRQWLVPPKPSVEFLVEVQDERQAA